jgi:RNA polymerase-binding protein DksA
LTGELEEVRVATNFALHRSRLKSEQERLNRELEQLKATARCADERREGSPFGKREEEATETAELETRLELEKRVRDQLAAVEHALSKFENKTYGLCDVCGQPINPERLEALPQANLCLKCKANQSKNAKGK